MAAARWRPTRRLMCPTKLTRPRLTKQATDVVSSCVGLFSTETWVASDRGMTESFLSIVLTQRWRYYVLSGRLNIAITFRASDEKSSVMPLSEVSDVSVKYRPTSSSACSHFERVTCPDSSMSTTRGGNHKRAKSIPLAHAMNCQQPFEFAL